MLVKHLDLGLQQALNLTLSHVTPGPIETISLEKGLDRIAAEDIHAKVDSPSVNASLKDGYAVISSNVAQASPQTPVRLKLIGNASAGGCERFHLQAGTAVRILTGARIPENADAVLSEEYVKLEDGYVYAANSAEPGRNILKKGSDVARGNIIICKGTRLSPGHVGLMAAAGHTTVPIYRPPKISIIATGDEVIVPGQPLTEGKLYASNMATLSAWCARYGFSCDLRTAADEAEQIHSVLTDAFAGSDAVITSGGAWTGDRDLVVKILDGLGWQKVFHRIRIGPGKAVGFGMLSDKPIFILPGGPPSNLMGFLQIALPGLLKLAGYSDTGLPTAPVTVTQELTGRFEHWTQFVFGTLEKKRDELFFVPLRIVSRLQSMADAQAVVAIPEGRTRLSAGMCVSAQLLS